MEFKEWLKAFLRTNKKYHKALKKLARPEKDLDGEPVPDKKEKLSELYRELEKAEQESQNDCESTSHDKLIKKLRKDLEK